LERFAAVASHDLQEPLRMVTSYVQLLARRYKGRLDADADEFIGFAADGANRMQRLINDLLAYARLSTRGGPFAPVDVEAALQQALVNLQVAIDENHAVVTHDPLPSVNGDATQFVQLLQNLVGNALKFRSDTIPQIHVSGSLTKAPSGDLREWIFSVRDNGIGIDPQYADQIFVMFRRLHSREAYAGTGIGLAICRRIVERHGGRIWVESEPGKGATFCFTIPVHGAA
jgi:light-regulated signal transduction histidine kinase (bacteriophytochrome)